MEISFEAVGAISLNVEKEGDEVRICASLKPELQCSCLEHEWRIKVEGPGNVIQEWGWRARASEEAYKGLSIKWKPPTEGEYRVEAELKSHGASVERSFRIGKARVAVVYYSRTGTTRKLVEKLVSVLQSREVEVSVHELRVRREYRKPLHINPRLIVETFRGVADVQIPEGFDPCAYSALVFACPIWAGKPAAPMASFLKSLAGKCPGKPVACMTTSLAALDYSSRLARLAEAAGFKVVYRLNATRGTLPGATSDLVKALLQK